jgi:hypothetical protein
MRVLPFFRGQAELKISKKKFISNLMQLTEKEYPLVRATSVSYGENLKEYGRELYEDSFLLWKIPSPGAKSSPFMFTVIDGRLIEKGDSITFKYQIRFNIWTNIVFVALVLLTFYLLYDSLFVNNNFKFEWLLIALGGYPLYLYLFWMDAKDDKAFLVKLISKASAN